jgi:pantoate--beta-alanine ligase
MAGIRKKGVSIGFVPTMGALHEGHLNLVKSSAEENDFSIVSVFVNPKQFNNQLDFEKYPVNIQGDIDILEKSGCDAVFIPSFEEVYPLKTRLVKLDLGILDNVFEGPGRPGHFSGVIQVVYRLFDLVKPTTAYFGLKDYQQCLVIKALKNEHFPKIRLQLCPTTREASGLAMSSRNKRLSAEGRKNASRIYSTLNVVKNLHSHIEAADAIKYGKHLLKNSGIEVEYLSLANADTLVPAEKWQRTNKNVLLVAAMIDGVRLIDNISF